MKSNAAIDLTAPQRDALRSVFSAFADRLDLVGVYGSRVQGTARPGSDVDLVLYGRLGRQDLAAIRAALEESDLSIFADVLALEEIDHDGLRAQVRHYMLPLFTRDELMAGRPAQAA